MKAATTWMTILLTGARCVARAGYFAAKARAAYADGVGDQQGPSANGTLVMEMNVGEVRVIRSDEQKTFVSRLNLALFTTMQRCTRGSDDLTWRAIALRSI